MMRLIAAVFILMITLQVKAQRLNLDSLFLRRGHVAFGGGIAVPLLSFGKSNSTQITAPNAQLGSHFRMEFGYEVGRNIGFLATWNFSNNPFNTAAYSDYFKTSLPYYLGGEKFTSLSSSPYQSNALLLGLYYPIRMVNTTYELRLQGGAMNLSRPSQVVTYTSLSGEKLKLYIDASESMATIIDVGIGARMRLSRYFILKGWIDYQYGKQEFASVMMHDRRNSITYMWIEKTDMYVHLFSAGIGLCAQIQ